MLMTRASPRPTPIDSRTAPFLTVGMVVPGRVAAPARAMRDEDPEDYWLPTVSVTPFEAMKPSGVSGGENVAACTNACTPTGRPAGIGTACGWVAPVGRKTETTVPSV